MVSFKKKIGFDANEAEIILIKDPGIMGRITDVKMSPLFKKMLKYSAPKALIRTVPTIREKAVQIIPGLRFISNNEPETRAKAKKPIKQPAVGPVIHNGFANPPANTGNPILAWARNNTTEKKVLLVPIDKRSM